MSPTLDRTTPLRTATPPAAPATMARPAGEWTVAELVAVVLERRRLLARVAVVAAVLAALVVGLAPRRYTARFSFFPRIAGATSGVSSLAAQFGLSVPGVDLSQSPQFYLDLLRSEDLLGALADSVTDATGRPVDLAALLSVSGTDRAAVRAELVNALRDVIEAGVSARAGIVEVEVRTGDARASQAIATRLLTLLHEFNLRQRREQADAERAFAADRLASAQRELAAAENALAGFVQRNRLYVQDPGLQVEYARRQRDVQLKHSTVMSLAGALEQARLDVARSTPVIAVVDAPRAPALPDRRRLVLKVGAAMLGAVLAGATLVLLLAGGTPPPGEARVRDALAATRTDLARPWRLLAAPATGSLPPVVVSAAERAA